MRRLSRSLSRFETQDIKTQPRLNHYKRSGYVTTGNDQSLEAQLMILKAKDKKASGESKGVIG
jgi:hypothetical protein